MVNSRYHLTRSQTSELRELWSRIRPLVEASRANHISLLLSVPQGSLTHSQLYMICSRVIEHLPDQTLPQWVADYLSQKLGDGKS